MRAELERARSAASVADEPNAEVELRLARDQLEATTAERDQLLHEVTMLRETVRYNRLKSVEARSGRSSDVPPDSIAGQFHAHAERIRELQGELEVGFSVPLPMALLARRVRVAHAVVCAGLLRCIG